MTTRTPRIGVLALGATAAIAIAGCGSDDSNSANHGGRDHGARRAARWSFTIHDAHGMVVTRFERDQTKLLHLIVVRSDLISYQHLHPTLRKAGRFTIPITLPAPGRYRAIADFTTAGKRYALGTELTAPGTAKYQSLPPATRTATTDGYTVKLDHQDLLAGKTTTVGFTISRGGRAVSRLQPYLGAYGHLVALRHRDIAYTHVHPVGQQLRRGRISFDAELPSAGSYRLFVQFRAGGRVHTAAFTVRARH